MQPHRNIKRVSTPVWKLIQKCIWLKAFCVIVRVLKTRTSDVKVEFFHVSSVKSHFEAIVYATSQNFHKRLFVSFGHNRHALKTKMRLYKSVETTKIQQTGKRFWRQLTKISARKLSKTTAKKTFKSSDGIFLFFYCLGKQMRHKGYFFSQQANFLGVSKTSIPVRAAFFA